MKQKKEFPSLSNPDKLLFPGDGITKLEYVMVLYNLSPYLLTYTENRYLTTIHFPDGVGEKQYYQKNIPAHAPEFVKSKIYENIEYIVMDSIETLLWMGNMAALEFHIPFNVMESENHPDAIVFDLDPSKGQTFSQVTEAALIIYETLKELGISSYCKTSGATGLQIAIPTGKELDYDTARDMNLFFGQYFAEKYPAVFTIERIVNARGRKLYFDYLQMWKGKTIISPYSPRATEKAAVSTPLLWEELKNGAKPQDFTLKNIQKRLEEKGDLYKPILTSAMEPGLLNILKWRKDRNHHI